MRRRAGSQVRHFSDPYDVTALLLTMKHGGARWLTCWASRGTQPPCIVQPVLSYIRDVLLCSHHFSPSRFSKGTSEDFLPRSLRLGLVSRYMLRILPTSCLFLGSVLTLDWNDRRAYRSSALWLSNCDMAQPQLVGFFLGL